MGLTKTRNLTKTINLIIGPVAFLLLYLILPVSGGITYAQSGAIGTVAWMAYWWITGPVDYAVTGLLPIAINAIFQIANTGDEATAFKTGMSNLLAKYADSTIMLILGASLITAAWSEIGLDKRISTKFLALIGNNMRGQVTFWYILTTLMSAVLPNAVVCAAITPIAVSMLKFVGEGDISGSKKASMVLMTIAYGAGVGGLASPLGGAMNLTVINYINEVADKELTYVAWFVKFLPIMIVLVVSNVIFLRLCCKKDEALSGSKEYFINEYKAMPKMTREEKISLVFFIVPTVLSFCQPFYEDYLPGLQPAYLFIIFGILSFLIKKENGERMMSWKSVEKNIVWDMIYIFGGGLAIGVMLKNSGADQVIGNLMNSFGVNGGFIMILIIVTITVLMSDITSNTAAAGIAVPVVIAMCGSAINPIPYILAATIGINLSYMLPTSIRAIPVGYGLSPKFMLKKGVPLTVIVIILMSITAFILMKTGFWTSTTL